ncbi:MAG: alpha-D-glucose phosphate-specific phosphoglucomutase [Gammaproteobacteria bacterium]|nr:alpha-D-glucose phosphate-specific phosphoglucomutase [Gammaproteobacteria bacterium]
MTHPRAGTPATTADLIDVSALENSYYSQRPDPENVAQRVAFGTSGHRGSPLNGTFNEAHILAVTQALCEYRANNGIAGPLFLGRDSHAISAPAQRTALEVLIANGVTTMIDDGDGYTPTPVVSHAILVWNRSHATAQADGIVITPSHNPPQDGGFKYNPPHGGPADTDATRWIETRANELLASGLNGVRRIDYAEALRSELTHRFNYMDGYISALGEVIDFDVMRGASINAAVDPLGGAGVAYWAPIAERYGLNLTVTNKAVDPTFSFMTLDWDGKIRMDCSSPYAMAGLIAMKDSYDLAFGNDTDTDRHGIVTPAGLMNPNHYLTAAIDYLFRHRPQWGADVGIGKTIVSSSMIDRVANDLGRTLYEVPVGFKWFVDGLYRGTLGFGGEESAGAAFLKRDGTTWCTDKDGVILNLLAIEMLARTGRNPHAYYQAIAGRLGDPVYERIDAPASPAQKAVLSKLSSANVTATSLAGAPITAVLSKAPGNEAAIGGVKVVTANGWFAARPSGTEDVYKLYAESFDGPAHLQRIQQEAQSLISATFQAAGL